MIRYKGFPYPSRTGKGRACFWVGAGGVPHDLPVLVGDHGLDWGMTATEGRPPIPRLGADALAFALCAGAVDEGRARAVYKRFQYRFVNALPVERPWSITDKEIVAHIERIEEDGRAAKVAIDTASRERAPVEHEGGIGAAGPMRWDTDEDGKSIPDKDGFTWTPAPRRRPE